MNTNKDIQELSDGQIKAAFQVNGLDIVRTVRAILAISHPAPVASTPAVAVALNVDALAQFIRRIDGNHSLGAGALAEKICEWLNSPQPSAAPVAADVARGMPGDIERQIIALEQRSDEAYGKQADGRMVGDIDFGSLADIAADALTLLRSPALFAAQPSPAQGDALSQEAPMPKCVIINAGGNTGSNPTRAVPAWIDGLPPIGTTLYAETPTFQQGRAAGIKEAINAVDEFADKYLTDDALKTALTCMDAIRVINKGGA